MRFRGARIVVSVSLLLSFAFVAPAVAGEPAPFSQAATFSAVMGGASSEAEDGNVDFPRFPAISPDGETIVFSWRGDLWKVPAVGGTAIRLSSHPADELRSSWSPDGMEIAFESTRDGYQNLYLMEADGSNIRPVTDTDERCVLDGFGVDEHGNEVITFSSNREGDFYRAPRPYMISTLGGDILRVHDAFGSCPAISPDGNRVAFTRGWSSWSRRGYRGPGSRDVWVFDRTDGSFAQVTDWEGNDGQAKWASDDTLIFMSDRFQNVANLCRVHLGDQPGEVELLTQFPENDVRDFDLSADGRLAVLSVWDTLYALRLDAPGAEPVALRISATEDEGDNYSLRSIRRDVTEAALSPNGKVMAYVAYGEVYVRNLDDKSPTRRVTNSHAREKDIAWSPDGVKLYFVSDRSGTDSIYAAAVELTRGEIKEAFEKATNPPKPKKKKEEKKDGDKEGEAKGDADEKVEAANEATPDPDPSPAPASAPADEPAATSQPTSTPTVEPAAAPTTQPASQPEPVATTQPTSQPASEDEAQPADEKKEGEAKKPEEKKGKKKGKKEEELPKELRPERWHDALKFTITDVVVEASNDRLPRPSPDGKSLGYKRGLGDIRILDLDTGETRPLLSGWSPTTDWAWSPDSRHIAYQAMDMNFNSDIWIVPADGSEPAVNVTRHPDNEFSPSWSADGKILLFISERVNEEYDLWRVCLDRELEAMTPKELEKYYADAVKAAKARKPLKPRKKPDDKKSDEAKAKKDETKPADAPKDDVEAADLKEENHEKTGDADKDENDAKKDDAEDDDKDDSKEKDADEKSKRKPLDLEDAYLRLRRVTSLPGNEGNALITPAGDRYIFTGNIDGAGLFSVKWDGTERKRLGSAASVQGISLKGDKLVIVSGGRAGLVPPSGGKLEYAEINDRIRIDLQEQSSQKFLEAARTIGEQFYHPTMKGRDWPALTSKYHALAKQTRTANEFNDVGARFIGELNASHLGIYASGDGSSQSEAMGRLGTVHHRVDDGFEVTEIIPMSPADEGKMALKVGDIITSIDFQPFGPTDTIETRLRGRVNEEVVLTVKRKPAPAKPVEGEDAPTTQPEATTTPAEEAVEEVAVTTTAPAEAPCTTAPTSRPSLEPGWTELQVLITPTNVGQENRLKYLAQRRAFAKLVEEWSDGRIGYIHIAGMGQGELDLFERDLYAAADGKEGLIIDVRNNGGGWTADRLLSSIMVQKHAYTIARGADRTNTDGYPQDRLFIQRYTLPINMLCNEHSFSNAEIISHAFKTLGRGTLVGQQTYGGVISTGGTRLIDGTFVRLPYRGWYLPDGTDMENNGAVPDLLIPQTPEAESKSDDEQLRGAVEDLLKRL